MKILYGWTDDVLTMIVQAEFLRVRSMTGLEG